MKIEKNVPIPDRYKTGKQIRLKYPFDKMDVGDSFFVKVHIKANRTKMVSNLCTIVAAYIKRHNPKHKFMTKSVTGGVRMWRIK